MLFATESVLLWLADVNRHPCLDDYVRAVGHDPRAPLDQILDRTAAAAARPGFTPDADWTLRNELRHAVFLYALVIEVNATVDSGVQRLAPLAVLSVRHLSLVTSLVGAKRLAASAPALMRVSAEDVDAARRAGLAVAAEVRGLLAMQAQIEREYLDGHSALFAQHTEAIQQLTEPATLIEELANGARRSRPVCAAPSMAAATHRDAKQLLASVLDRARVTALQHIREADSAAELMLDRLDDGATGYTGAAER